MNSDHESPKYSFKCTPPTNRKVRNPFDRALISRLHKPICSPSMCKVFKKKNNGLFRWDIDHACTLAPADIVPCNSQFDPSPDPALEKIAEEATEKFFSQEMVMPSPLESSKKIKPLQTSQSSIEASSYVMKESIVTRDVSAQTILTLPPNLPPELEKALQPYFTFTQEQDISGEYEITANGSLRRKLLFEEHSDAERYDSEHSEDEGGVAAAAGAGGAGPDPPLDHHSPLVFSPDLTRDLVGRGMQRTFETPLRPAAPRNKYLDVADFGGPCSPIHSQFHTPPNKRPAAASLQSSSISPVDNVAPGDERRFFLSSPPAGRCECRSPPLRRSASLRLSPRPRSAERRSLSLSSLRSRSVQRLDFSADMSLDASCASQTVDQDEPVELAAAAWTPVSGRRARAARRAPRASEMSLDRSGDDPLALEDKQVDFTAAYLTEPIKTTFRRVDSGFNEHTFYASSSSYYESAIRPSELTVTETAHKPLKEISNVNWMRVDSGFKDETSNDTLQFYTGDGSKSGPVEKENNFSHFLQGAGRSETMSMSDIFNEEMSFNCNFSSTPSKGKSRFLQP